MPRQLSAAAVALITATALTPAALAEPPPDQGGRYTLSPADDGFVRLDRRTGAMSFCTKKDDGWRCNPMADGSETLRKEIERLQSENESLKANKKHLEEMLGMNDPGDPSASEPGPSPHGSMKIPTEEDVDRVFDYIEGMVKKLKERIERIEKEADRDQTL